MSNRAEAIDTLTRMSTNHFYGHREQEALKLGAEALKQVNRMDDLISRQAAIDAFRKELCREREYATPFVSLKGCERILNELPSAERREAQLSGCRYWDDESNFCALYRPSAERFGRWEDVEHAPNGLFYATCSVCGDRQTIEVANYCPMCGASMMDDNAIQHTKCVGNALDALDEVEE